MIYCPATENGYESLADKPISVFFPTFGKDDKGNDIIEEPAQAKTGDYLILAMAAIIAYCSREKIPTPVSTEYILYEATPQERNDMLTAITELRNQWYIVPKVVEGIIREESDGKGKGGRRKNA